jgi:hypothetical protein
MPVQFLLSFVQWCPAFTLGRRPWIRAQKRLSERWIGGRRISAYDGARGVGSALKLPERDHGPLTAKIRPDTHGTWALALAAILGTCTYTRFFVGCVCPDPAARPRL